MVDHDLRALAAPIEALRDDVNGAYEALDAKWSAVDEQLQKLPIPCSISYTYSENERDPEQYMTLEWRKWKGGRKLCTVYHHYEHSYNGLESAEDVTPYDEWSAEHRAEMLRHVPALFKAAEEQVKAFVKRICGSEVTK